MGGCSGKRPKPTDPPVAAAKNAKAAAGQADRSKGAKENATGSSATAKTTATDGTSRPQSRTAKEQGVENVAKTSVEQSEVNLLLEHDAKARYAHAMTSGLRNTSVLAFNFCSTLLEARPH
eukprot:2765311-Amphidinium_carterae.1